MENDWLQCASFHQDLLTRNHDERRFDINLSKQPNLPYMEGKFERWLQVFCFFFVFLEAEPLAGFKMSTCLIKPVDWSITSGGWQATLNTLPNEVAAEWLTLTHFWLIKSRAWGSVRRGRNSQPNTVEATRFLESWSSFPARLLCSRAAPGGLWDASASDELEFIDAAFCSFFGGLLHRRCRHQPLAHSQDRNGQPRDDGERGRVISLASFSKYQQQICP